MKILLVILFALFSNDPKEIAKINALKKKAEEAYLEGNYEQAAITYQLLTDSLKVEDEFIKLNLGHSYYHLGDTANAKLNYGQLGMSTNKKLKSIAYQQLGVMSKDEGKLEQSLQQLKSAIKSDPSNKEAVYNYEVVKKLLENKKKQEQQNKENKEQRNQEDQEQQNKENQEQQNQEKNEDQNKENKKQEKSQNQEQNQQEEQAKQQQKEGGQEEQRQKKTKDQMTKEKLDEMGISEEKALQLLEAMRQSEIKYLQNQKRKATKKPSSDKPDW